MFYFIEFLENLTDQQKDGIASVLILQKFSKGQNIVCEGDPGSSYYIIKEVYNLLFFLRKLINWIYDISR